MKLLFRHLLFLLLGRFARNLYFWALVLFILWNNDPESYKYPASVYRQFMPFTLLVLAGYTYTNNLWLLPHYFVSKRYSRFFSLNALFTLVFSFLMVVVLKAIRTDYPLMEVYHISPLTSPVSLSWTAGDMLVETLWFAVGFVIWEVVLTMAWFANQYYKKEKEADLYRQKQTEAELNMLRNQVNPHFLFNTLNNIYGLALRKTDEAPEAILKLSSFMRYLLYEGSKERVSSVTELSAMQAYIDLELLRISDHSSLMFSLDTDREYDMPGLIWLPILENAFKHGTRIISPDMFIDYRFSIRSGLLSISCRNYYKEVSSSTGELGTGLANLEKRLMLLYRDKYVITKEKEHQVFSIHLQLQLS